MCFLNRALNLHLVLSSFLLLVFSDQGQLQVIGSSQPIAALIGDYVTLPCRLGNGADAWDMTVEWARPDLDPRFVLVWRDGNELASKKHPSYRGRTSLSIEGLRHGDISLTLSKVRQADEGTYKCLSPNVGETFIKLVVGAASSPAIVSIDRSSSGGGVVLQCESAGWYPEPEVLWLDAEGNLLSAGPPETVRGPDDLYTVSSRVTVDKRHSNSFTCRVQQNNINQTRETHIRITDDFFMAQKSPAVCITAVIGSVVFLLLCLVLIFVYQKWKQKNTRFREIPKQHGDKELQLVEEEEELENMERPRGRKEQKYELQY